MEDEIIETKKKIIYKEVPYITNLRHFMQVAGLYGFKLANMKIVKTIWVSDGMITVVVNCGDCSIKYLKTITTSKGTPIETEVTLDKDDQLWIFRDLDYLIKFKKEEVCQIARK